MPIRKQTKMWTTRDGRKLRICDMSQFHLENAIAYLERKAERMKWKVPFPCFNGDAAQDCAEREYYSIMEDPAPYLFPIYRTLCLEYERRSKLV